MYVRKSVYFPLLIGEETEAQEERYLPERKLDRLIDRQTDNPGV